MSNIPLFDDGSRPLCQDCNSPRDWIMDMGFPVSLCQRCYENSPHNHEPAHRPPELRSLIRAQVLAFHKKFGQAIGEKLHIPDADTMRFRASLITEEYFEAMRALFGDLHLLEDAEDSVQRAISDFVPFNGERENPLVEFVDAMADLDYVVEGTRITMGIDGGPISAEVQRANMTKVPSVTGDRYGGVGKEMVRPMKPEGWKSPDIAGELKKQGWKP